VEEHWYINLKLTLTAAIGDSYRVKLARFLGIGEGVFVDSLKVYFGTYEYWHLSFKKKCH
jgi:hypothetical protein